MKDAVAGSQRAVLDLGITEATVALDAGPRIVGYRRLGGQQLFAQLAGEVIENDSMGDFAFVGGHRLWRAPEVPAVTYQPDDSPVTVDWLDRGVQLAGSPDSDGITKVIRLQQVGAVTIVDHTLRHEGSVAVRCAAWAITQLAVGGYAVLPQSLRPVDGYAVLPNRSLVLWPYTDPSDPELEFRTAEVRVAASTRRSRAKLGLANRCGWQAYVLDDELFVKWSPMHDDSLVYTDLGATVQCYRDQRFLELETLGPITELKPGGEIHHREVWMLSDLKGSSPEAALAELPLDPIELTT